MWCEKCKLTNMKKAIYEMEKLLIERKRSGKPILEKSDVIGKFVGFTTLLL